MINSTESGLLRMIADNLGVNYLDLYRLIKFESGWNPQAKNPQSSARGLIQFTDNTARSLGLMDSLDLVSHYPTITDQLPLVERYLLKFKPFPTKQSLYMSVFYPAARKWDKNKRFPDSIITANPGVYTPEDYAAKVEGRKVERGGVLLLIIAAGYLFYKLLKKERA